MLWAELCPTPEIHMLKPKPTPGTQNVIVFELGPLKRRFTSNEALRVGTNPA